jgi:hypothetical protein
MSVSLLLRMRCPLLALKMVFHVKDIIVKIHNAGCFFLGGKNL